MASNAVDNINIATHETLMTPDLLKKEIPISASAKAVVTDGRKQIEAILNREDRRIFAIVGPCSIHDVNAAKEYAGRLKLLADKVKDQVLLVMRVYFEKPRTTVGWKGLINDPYMDDSFKIVDGLKIGRQLLHDILEMGLPTATEALDPISPQYMHDLIAWSAIGARTTESQTHREMASGLSSPVGFKNGTDGSLNVAINALKSVANPHRFLGINGEGGVSVITTRGNNNAHIVLRGGGGRPNFDSINVSLCEDQLTSASVPANIMVDCSHENSNKDHQLQPLVLENISNQIADGNESIIGLMIESNINSGNQKPSANPNEMKYGVSVTDACIDWETTEHILVKMAADLDAPLKKRENKVEI